VIYDSGHTQPIAPYLRQAFGQPARTTEPAPAQNLKLPAIDPHTFGLPVQTPALTPGPVAPHPLQRAPPRPLCLLGTDPRSRRWLTRYRRRLRAVGAVCLLVNVDTSAELQTIRRLAAGIPLLPASGAALARQLGLKHYPVLISRQSGIEQ
jgi:integrating conjugative element protein (TIGR03765 family)